uniref:Uncharacterized protein n=1 Tax=Anguilla anguilla TaxID=7936 RepID=A0A0E9RJN0_ANGAN
MATRGSVCWNTSVLDKTIMCNKFNSSPFLRVESYILHT